MYFLRGSTHLPPNATWDGFSFRPLERAMDLRHAIQSLTATDSRGMPRTQPIDGSHHRIFHEEYSGGESGGGGSGVGW